MKKQSKMIFLFASFFFILGLNLHSVDGLAEFHDLVADKVEVDSFMHEKLYHELKFLEVVETQYGKCKDNYEANKDKYHQLSEQVLDPIRTNYSNMLEVTNEVKAYIMCSKMLYEDIKRDNLLSTVGMLWITEIVALQSSYAYFQGHLYYKEKDEEFAKLLAEHSATLAALGAHPSNEDLYEAELKEYLHTVEKDGSQKSDMDLPYIDYVTQMRNLIYANYDHSAKSFDIILAEYQETFNKIEEYGDQFTSYIADILFANEKIHPGSEVRKPKYGKPSFQQMWDSENFKEAIRNIKLPWAQPVDAFLTFTRDPEELLLKFIPKKPTDEKKEEEKDNVEKNPEDSEKSTEKRKKEEEKDNVKENPEDPEKSTQDNQNKETEVRTYEVTNIPLQLIREVEAQMIQARPLPDAERGLEELKRKRQVIKLRRGWIQEADNEIHLMWLVKKSGHKPVFLFTFSTFSGNKQVAGDGMGLPEVDKKYNTIPFYCKK